MSGAISEIISRYLLGESNPAILARIERLEAEVAELRGKQNDCPDNDQSSTPVPKLRLFPLSGRALARRLRVSPATVTNHRHAMPQYSLRADPDGVAWEYDSDLKKYLPVGNQAIAS